MSTPRTISAIACSFVLAMAVVLLEVAVVVSTTVLNPAFVTSQLAAVELHPLVAEEAVKQVPAEASFVVDIIDAAAPELESWAQEQASRFVYAVDTYLEGEESFSVVVSLVEPKAVLAAHVEQAIRAWGLPQVPGLPVLSEDTAVELVLGELNNRIPDQLAVDETFLNAETLAGLRQARRYASYVDHAMRVLPVACMLCVLLIAALCSWRPRMAASYVGVALCGAGIAALATAGLARVYLPRAIPDAIPAQLVAFVSGFIAECCRPLFVYATATLGVGACVLLLVLWLESRRRAGG